MNAETIAQNLDMIWIVISAALVLFMQAGFAALESGLTRAKNSINVAAKNITDLVLSVLVFWFVGYGLMFGASEAGWYGADKFFFDGNNDPYETAVFLFQATFAGTAVTIVSGAVAERMVFTSYAVMAVIVTALIYPVAGHWIWNGDGWLAQKGMLDFAGATVVHSVGAWIGLAGAWLLGPRMGRFDASGKATKLHGHNLVMAVMGTLILVFGWFGFNGGSVLAVNSSVAVVIANTILAAAAGGIACFGMSQIFQSGLVSVEKLLNGTVGGLVAITACAPWLTLGDSIILGFIAGIIVYIAEELMLHVFKIDDPVNVISAHGIAGVWGTLGMVFFLPDSMLANGSAWQQFTIQFTGVLSVFLWSFILSLIVFFIFKQSSYLRVKPNVEEEGLNIHEHGASSTLSETARSATQLITEFKAKGHESLSASNRVLVEQGSEGGEIAMLFNELMDIFDQTIGQIKDVVVQLDDSTEVLLPASGEMVSDADRQVTTVGFVRESMEQLSNVMVTIGEKFDALSTVAGEANQNAEDGKSLIEDCINTLKDLNESTAALHSVVEDLKDESKQIENFLSSIGDIAEQTNLLALNAAIEAARAGDTGRGFAVVADEVRSLSQRTQEAAEEINERINHLNQRVDQLSDNVDQNIAVVDMTQRTLDQTGERFSAILSSVSDTQQLVEDSQQVAQDGLARNREVNSHIDELAELSGTANERATKLGHCSTTLGELARSLKTMLSGEPQALVLEQK